MILLSVQARQAGQTFAQLLPFAADVHGSATTDVDFLLGERDAARQDSFVLCEINASSTLAFPEAAMPTVAQAALEQIRQRCDPSEEAS